MNLWMRLIANAARVPGVSSAVIYMTADLARLILEHNTRNRKISRSVIDKYKAEIRNKEWYATCGGVGIDVNGVVIDGQHRLIAIAETGITVPLLVVWGLPPAAQLKIDRQLRRTLYDNFKLGGLDAGRKAVQIATALVKMQGGPQADSEIRACLEARHDAIAAVVDLTPVQKCGWTAAVCAAFVPAWEIDPPRTQEFIAKALDPHSLDGGDPRYRFSRWIIGPMNRYGGAARQRSDFLKTLFCIDAYFRGKKINSVREATSIDVLTEPGGDRQT